MFCVLSILILSCVTHGFAVKPDYKIYDLDKVVEHFETFKKDFGKEYKSKEEDKKRFEIFKANLISINKRNQEDVTATYGINQFSDMTLEELHQSYTGVRFNASTKKVDFVQGPEAPESLDWRESNAVTEVRDQGRCGSCFAFSAIGEIEGQNAIKHQQLVQLSVQEALDCSSGECEHGGFPVNVMNTLALLGGAEAESDYPYTGEKGNCRSDSGHPVVSVAGGSTLNVADEEELKNALANHGPLSVCIFVSNGVSSYNGGVFNGEDCGVNHPNHAVLLVGYGTEDGVPYWIIKNSWGTRYGDQGYLRMIRGNNACGILALITQSQVN